MTNETEEAIAKMSGQDAPAQDRGEKSDNFSPTHVFGDPMKPKTPVMAMPGEYYIPPDKAQDQKIRPVIQAMNEGSLSNSVGAAMKKLSGALGYVRKPIEMATMAMALHGAVVDPVNRMTDAESQTPFPMYVAERYSEARRREELTPKSEVPETGEPVGMAAGGEVVDGSLATILKKISGIYDHIRKPIEMAALTFAMYGATAGPVDKMTSNESAMPYHMYVAERYSEARRREEMFRPDKAKDSQPIVGGMAEGGEVGGKFDSIMKAISKAYGYVRKPVEMATVAMALHGAVSEPVDVAKAAATDRNVNYHMYVADKYAERKREDELIHPQKIESGQEPVGMAGGGDVLGYLKRLGVGIGMFGALLNPYNEAHDKAGKEAPVPIQASVAIGKAAQQIYNRGIKNNPRDEIATKDQAVGKAEGGWIDRIVGTEGVDSEPVALEKDGFVVRAEQAQKPENREILESISYPEVQPMFRGGDVGRTTSPSDMLFPDLLSQSEPIAEASESDVPSQAVGDVSETYNLAPPPPPPPPPSVIAAPSDSEKLSDSSDSSDRGDSGGFDFSKLASMFSKIGTSGSTVGAITKKYSPPATGWGHASSLHRSLYGHDPIQTKGFGDMMGEAGGAAYDATRMTGIASMGMPDVGGMLGSMGGMLGGGGEEGGGGDLAKKAGMVALMVAAPELAPLIGEAGGMGGLGGLMGGGEAGGMLGGLMGGEAGGIGNMLGGLMGDGGEAGATGGGGMGGMVDVISGLFGSRNSGTGELKTASDVGGKQDTELVRTMRELIATIKDVIGGRGGGGGGSGGMMTPASMVGLDRGPNYGAMARNSGK